MKNAFSRILILTVFLISMPLSLAFADVKVIDSEEARMQAAMALVGRVAFETPLLEEWKDATLGAEFLIFDPARKGEESKPLVYDFDVMVHNEAVGRVSVPATSLFGTTCLSLNVGIRPYSIHESLDAAVDRVQSQYPGAVVLSALPVIYQYPKVAAMVDVELAWPAGQYKVFVELPTLRILQSDIEAAYKAYGLMPFINPGCEDPAPGKTEIYYFHDSVPGELIDELNISHDEEWELVHHTMVTLNQTLDVDLFLGSPIYYTQWPEIKELLLKLEWFKDNEEILPTYNCKLIKQEEGDWCARAVAQMIMYYHFNTLFHSQAQIDAYLNKYGWEKDWQKSMKKYYVNWLCLPYSYFDQNITTSTMNDPGKQKAGFDNLKKQIDDGYPLCDGVPVHARMVMAYSIYGHGQFFTKYDVGIYDPDMYNGGARWETGWKEGMFGFSQVAPRYFMFVCRDKPYA